MNHQKAMQQSPQVRQPQAMVDLPPEQPLQAPTPSAIGPTMTVHLMPNGCGITKGLRIERINREWDTTSPPKTLRRGSRLFTANDWRLRVCILPLSTMSTKETQIDWASKEFSKAAKAVEQDSGLYHIAV